MYLGRKRHLKIKGRLMQLSLEVIRSGPDGIKYQHNGDIID